MNLNIEEKKKISVNLFKISIIALIVFFALFLLWNKLGPESSMSDRDMLTVDLYFRNSVTYEWEKEQRQIKIEQETDMVQALLNELRKGPRSQQFLQSIPEFVETAEVNLTWLSQGDGIVEITFTDSYKEMSASEATDLMCSLVWTLSELDFINNLHFYIEDEELLTPDGKPAGQLNRENVVLEAGEMPDKNEIQTVKLYFADKMGMGLVMEERDIEKYVNEPIEFYIVKAMIDGPQNQDLLRIIPPETSVISTAVDGVTCFVDLSSEFIDRLDNGSTTEQLAVASIVNALTEITKIRKVQILIEGDKMIQTGSGIDLSKPFERMEDLIIQ